MNIHPTSLTAKVLQPTGVLDGVSGERLQRDIEALVASGVTTVLLDCCSLERIDNTGVKSLLQYHVLLQQAGGRLLLSDLSEPVYGLLMWTGLDTLLTVL